MLPTYNGTKYYIHILKTRTRNRARKDQSKSKPKPGNTDDKHSSSMSGVWSLDGIMWAPEGLRATPTQNPKQTLPLISPNLALGRSFPRQISRGRCLQLSTTSLAHGRHTHSFTNPSFRASYRARFSSFHTLFSFSNFLAPWCKTP